MFRQLLTNKNKNATVSNSNLGIPNLGLNQAQASESSFCSSRKTSVMSHENETHESDA
jgi:hypothetical protein